MSPFQIFAQPLHLDPEARRRLAQSGAVLDGRRDPLDISRGIYKAADAISNEFRRLRG